MANTTRFGRRLRSLLLALPLSAGLPAGGLAQPAPPPHAAQPADSLEDWRLESRLFQAMRGHAELARLHPGVTVEQGRATLFGSLPSEALHRELLRLARATPGVRGVESKIRIVRRDELPDRVAELVLNGPGQATPLPDGPASQERVIVRAEPATQPPLQSTSARADGRSPAATMSAPTPRTALKPERPAGEEAEEYLRRTRQSDQRYRELEWTLEDGTLKLRGKVDRLQDAWDLADLLAGTRGIRRVVLDGVKAK